MRVLYFTKSAGYEHSVVRHADGEPSHSEKILAQIGAAHDIEFTFSKDGSLFSPDYLDGFDVVMFYTSGDLFSVGEDGNPPLTPSGKQALLDAIAGGKGFIAIHSGGDTFHTGESGGGNPADRRNRYKIHGEAADPYIRMLGGEFINHGKQQDGRATVPDPAFPGCAALGDAFECYEEWYSLKEFSPDLHVVLVLETEGMEGVDYQRPPSRSPGRGTTAGAASGSMAWATGRTSGSTRSSGRCLSARSNGPDGGSPPTSRPTLPRRRRRPR